MPSNNVLQERQVNAKSFTFETVTDYDLGLHILTYAQFLLKQIIPLKLM